MTLSGGTETNETVHVAAGFKLDMISSGMDEWLVKYVNQAVNDGDGASCPLRYYRRGTDIYRRCWITSCSSKSKAVRALA